jgi:hypothetical protein
MKRERETGAGKRKKRERGGRAIEREVEREREVGR